MSTVLSLSGVSKSFGGLKVIDDVSFAVPKGSRTALIGPNGAGKSTVFNLISGVYPIDSGGITALGQDITHMSVGTGWRMVWRARFKTSGSCRTCPQ